jgi:hypothetical protein
MSDLLSDPYVVTGLSILGVPPLPDLDLLDEHIAAVDAAAAYYRELAADGRYAYQLAAANQGLAANAVFANLTGSGGALSETGDLAERFSHTADGLRITRTLIDWAAGVLAVLAVLAVAVAAFFPETLAQLIAMARRISEMIRAGMRVVGRLLRALTKRIKARAKGRRYVNVHSRKMTEEFGKAPLYRKTATVRVRDGRMGERVDTTLADGTHETTNYVTEPGSKIVTNPGGESQILGPEKFKERYDDSGDGTAKPKGMVRAFDNPTGKDVTIDPPWGGSQEGGIDSKFAMAVDPAAPEAMTADRYIIGGKEFGETYEPLVPNEPPAGWRALGEQASEHS